MPTSRVRSPRPSSFDTAQATLAAIPGVTGFVDYRITCIFVDKRHRGRGYAKVALAGALDLIAAQGGGVVEGYPHELGEKRMNNSFVCNGTRAMYEEARFGFVRSEGLKNTVVRRTVEPA